MGPAGELEFPYCRRGAIKYMEQGLAVVSFRLYHLPVLFQFCVGGERRANSSKRIAQWFHSIEISKNLGLALRVNFNLTTGPDTYITTNPPTPHLRLALLMILSTNILRENFSMVQKPVSGKLGQR